LTPIRDVYEVLLALREPNGPVPRLFYATDPALRLSTEERAAVAAELIQSLDEQATEDVESAWAEEIQQRLLDVDAGVVTPIPWPEAKRRIFAAANGRREAP
jgi:putative addiction module component (TIGR02574 family)